MTLETFLDDLADYLEANDVAPVSVAGNFEHFENKVYISPYGGLAEHGVVTTDANPFGLDVQLLVSNLDNEVSWRTASKIIRLLRDVHNQTIGDTHFIYIQQKYGPFFVGKSNAGYYSYSLNFSLLMQ